MITWVMSSPITFLISMAILFILITTIWEWIHKD